MGHLGTACNLLTTIGGTPAFNDKDFVPQYPTTLPCDIYPKVIPPNVLDWKVGLSRLTPAVVSDVFMIIEYPEKGPVPTTVSAAAAAARQKFYTIGEFYDAIADTLKYLVGTGQVEITGKKQLSELFGHSKTNVVEPITTLDEALSAIERIKEQGEGTPSTPDAPLFGHELAHYYKFKQIQVGRNYVQVDNCWTLSGDFFDFPSVYHMADIPSGGYNLADLPPDVAVLISKFNNDYKEILASLQSAWEKGGKEGQKELLHAEIDLMDGLGSTAVDLMKNKPIDTNKGYYGPTFQVS